MSAPQTISTTIRGPASGGATAALFQKRREGRVFSTLCAASAWSSFAVLLVLLGSVVWQAWGWLDWQYLTSFDSSLAPERAGILAGLWGTFWTIGFTILFSVPLGVGAAVYLEEYATDTRLTRVIRTNIANLAGVPSIVYGILGLTVFVRMFDLFGAHGTFQITAVNVLGVSIPLPLGRSVLSGSLTLTLLVLPVIIVAAQEALRAVPPSLRHASLALGATRWQTIRHQVLPSAVPGILTGIILAGCRAIGETAPLILIGALTFVRFAPGNITSVGDIVREPGALLEAPFDTFTVMPLQIFNWVRHPDPGYHHIAAAGILVLLTVLLLLNAAAIYIRNRFQRNVRY